jgi:hypothetical protein
MFRLLIAGLLIYLLWSFWKKATQAARSVSTSQGTQGEGPSPAVAPAEMVACARCGTFVLKAEAISQSGQAYCSKACAQTPG